MNASLRLLVALVACAAMTSRATADVQVDEQDGGLTVFKLRVTPAAEPVPALQHRLVLRDLDAKPGNAATFYYRALMAVEEGAKAAREKLGEDYDKWNGFETPLADLSLARARDAVQPFDSRVVLNLREAAARRECDWGWQLDAMRGPGLFGFLLPEIQLSRELTRAMALRARLAIAEHRYDDALDDLRINYKLARDIAAEPLLINALVGVAEASTGHKAVIELIGAPNSPNLYWALGELPQPFVDMREATRFEMSSAFRVFPFMINAETTEHSPEEWARLLAAGLTDVGPLIESGPNFNEFGARAGVTGLSLVTYPPAKQRLIAAGLDAERVERMPVGQVIAIDAAREYRRLADEVEKWWYAPFREARRHSGDADKQLTGGNKFEGGYGRMLASMLLPALSNARTTQMRLEWQTGALQTVEAIRMHAAATGKLPASLDDVKVVPLPENPVTGKPYQYRLDGTTGVLELPASDGFPIAAWRFEITLAE